MSLGAIVGTDRERRVDHDRSAYSTCRAAASPICCGTRRRSARGSTPARGERPSAGHDLYKQFFRDARPWSTRATRSTTSPRTRGEARAVTGAERHGGAEYGDPAPHHRGAVREDGRAGHQPRRRRHRALGALHLGLARLVPDAQRGPSSLPSTTEMQTTQPRSPRPGAPRSPSRTRPSWNLDRRRGRFRRAPARAPQSRRCLRSRTCCRAGASTPQLLDELETRLIAADVGIETTEKILGDLRKKVAPQGTRRPRTRSLARCAPPARDRCARRRSRSSIDGRAPSRS